MTENKSQSKRIKSELEYFVFDHITTLVVLSAFFGTAIGFYAYFCLFMAPEVTVTDIDVRYSQNRDSDTKLLFKFKVENIAYGKSIKGELYTTLLSLKPNAAIKVFGYNFSELPNLIEEQKITIPAIKTMNYEEFLQHIDDYGGLFSAIVVRWRSHNPVFWGRIYENNVLVFLRPAPGENFFFVEYVEQAHRTYWFKKTLPSPDMSRHIKKLDSLRLAYEEIRNDADPYKKYKK